MRGERSRARWRRESLLWDVRWVGGLKGVVGRGEEMTCRWEDGMRVMGESREVRNSLLRRREAIRPFR